MLAMKLQLTSLLRQELTKAAWRRRDPTPRQGTSLKGSGSWGDSANAPSWVGVLYWGVGVSTMMPGTVAQHNWDRVLLFFLLQNDDFVV